LESIALLFSKFSNEMISAQLGLLCFLGAIGLYWMLVRKHNRNRNEWVPAAIVKDYLDRMARDESETRMRLFGEASRVSVGGAPATVQQVIVSGTDPAVMKELEALRAQLAVADKRTVEFDKNISTLKAEKDALEKKLKEAPAAAAGGTAKADPAVAKELESTKKEAEELKARLAEYEVIEDDLANLKKYQIENKELREKLGIAGDAPVATEVKAAPKAAVVETVVKAEPAPAPVETVVKAAEPAPAPVETVVKAEPAPAPVETVVKADAPVAAVADPVAAAPAAAPAPAEATATAPTDPAAAPADGAAAAAPVAEMPKSSKQKEDELLSEFEKMLAS
jgi:hypothetical protein